jgi:hypothetical protein
MLSIETSWRRTRVVVSYVIKVILAILLVLCLVYAGYFALGRYLLR